jgi:DNA primase
MQISQNIIDEVVHKADIVEIIGRDLKLRRSGNNYFACCPFHKEKTASFSINASSQYFHCFGCGESGNVITFVMKYSGLDFVDAVKSLANTYGVIIQESTVKISAAEAKAYKEKKFGLTEIINKVVQFYRHNLISSSVATGYLKHRGLSQEIIDKFQLGYTPNSTNSLNKVVTDYATNSFLVDAGLTIKNDNGTIYERFRDRIMFPIRNVKGEVIAFGGRIIAHGEPKYLNSPETVLFNKSNEMYGLFESGRQIRDKNYVIIVEGYMDVIALFQFGIDNVVATMGTSVTEEHIKKLFRLCDDIYYCFDGDNAGHKAAWRALERSVPIVGDAKAAHFLFLPSNHDPDSFIREHGVDGFTKQIKDKSLSMSAFLLNQLSSEVNLTTDEGKARLISLVKPYIEKVSAVALQVMLKKQLANLVELSPDVLESILNNRSRYAFYNSKWNKNQLVKTTKPAQPSVLSTLELIINSARNHIEWVINYRLPDDLDQFGKEIQELVLFLDFISNNYAPGDQISVGEITNNIEFNVINFKQIYSKDVLVDQVNAGKVYSRDKIEVSVTEFNSILDKLFGRTKTKANKIPKIVMKGKSNEH